MGDLLHCREALLFSQPRARKSVPSSRVAFCRSNDVRLRRIGDSSDIVGTLSTCGGLRRTFAGGENFHRCCDGGRVQSFSSTGRTVSAGCCGRLSRTWGIKRVNAPSEFWEDSGFLRRDRFRLSKVTGVDSCESSALFGGSPSICSCGRRVYNSRHFSEFDIHCYGQGVHSHTCYSLSNSIPVEHNLGRSRNVYHRGSFFDKRRYSHTRNAKGKPWWKEFLFQQLNEDDIAYGDEEEEDNQEGPEDFDEDEDFLPNLNGGNEEIDPDEVDRLLSDDRKFFSWRQKREAIDELREYQETERDPDSRDWEDWLDESWDDPKQAARGADRGWYEPQSEWEKEGVPRDAPKKPERGMNRTIKELLMRVFENQEEVEDDLSFEERVFRFTSQSTTEAGQQTTGEGQSTDACPENTVDFLVHDYVMAPFLRRSDILHPDTHVKCQRRWVEEVPLAAKVLDLKESQKLHMIEELKLERQRVRFESEIGKAPPLTDEELNEHIREVALDLREELREENRQAFGNLWSDALAGFTVFLLLVLNPAQVSIMKMTGDRLFTNISDTGKAFIIILGTDIFLGYHSESGWETVIEMLLDHYGLEASQASIYIFVAIVPVTIDACFKLWVFRYLTRLSPSAAATFREMKRH